MKKIIKIIILAFIINSAQSQDNFLDFPIDKPIIQPLTSEYYRGYDKPTLGPLLTFGGGLFLTSGLLTKPPTYVDMQGNIRPLRFGKQGNRMYIMNVGSTLILNGKELTNNE